MSSFGEELRRERELRRITLREVSEATKITLRYLEALEKNEFDQLPGGVFNRGFVRAYAQFIGVDPEAMVTAYLLEEQTRSGADADSRHAGDVDALLRGRAPAGSPRDADSRSGGMPAWTKWLLALIAVAALAVGGVFLARWLSDDGPRSDRTTLGTGDRPAHARSAEANHR
jgi:cytoskeletal protein RodZ